MPQLSHNLSCTFPYKTSAFSFSETRQFIGKHGNNDSCQLREASYGSLHAQRYAMPVFLVNTNVKDVPADFKKLATDVIAMSLGKPHSYIAVQVNSGQDISFGGTDEPAALCDLTSIGALSVESNKKHSMALMELLEEKLKVEPTRAYISFHNLNKADIGYSGTTFDDLI